MAEESAALGRALDDAADRSSERVYSATQWQLMWWRLRRHRLAMVAAVVLIGFYIVVLGANFLAISDPQFSEAFRGEMPPQRLHFFDGWSPGLYVNGVTGARDLKTFK